IARQSQLIMNTAESKEPTYIGIDVGKSFLDVYFHPLDFHQRIENTEKDINALVEVIADLQPERVVVQGKRMKTLAITGLHPKM
ncbi:hypothetical protein M3P05_20780, partial [Sansalvadorimonas sp. 2012CJ34-2]|nr:hypothetical protein [Sansalvadorimonas sp. 2012CJ34-2]